MQSREVAVKVIETLLDVAEKLDASVDMTAACAQEGKISKEEADAYRTRVLGTLDELYLTIISPIYDVHPDLRPTCCCGEPTEDETDLQP